MKTENKGFTLIELIVVVVITAAFMALVGLTVSTVNNARIKRASEAVSVLISKCRTDCLSKAGGAKLVLSLDDDGNIVADYYENGTKADTDTISGRGVFVTYELSGSQTFSLEGHPLTLSFYRDTGAQKPQSEGGTTYCTEIKFTGSRTYTIELVPSTGNHRQV